MLIYCSKCGGDKTKVYKSTTTTVEFRTLYVLCLNPSCMHRFVSNLTYSHTLSEPDFKIEEDLFNRVCKLQPEQLKQLILTIENKLLTEYSLTH